ncbi:MAG TPA: hypothetical protein PLV92_02910 [Pirellulaceae bacterium]|nr:hypothetical protein [Pirellulaceae bacterium]
MRIDFQTGEPRALANLPGPLAAAGLLVGQTLGDRYYGPGLRRIYLDFRATLPKGRPPRASWRYRGTFAEQMVIEVVGIDPDSQPVSAASLREILDAVPPAVARSRELWQGEFRESEFFADLAACIAAAPAADAELRALLAAQVEARKAVVLKELVGEERHRFESRRPCTVPLVGMRFYPRGRLKDALNPELTNCGQLVEGLLRNLGLKTPGYREIYVNLAETLEEARLQRAAIEDWHENAYSVLNADEFALSSPEGRFERVTAVLEGALLELARIDHLDVEIIQGAFRQIRATGLKTKLTYLSEANAKIRARIIYRVVEDGGDPHYQLEVDDLAQGRSATIDLGRRDPWWVPYSFSRLKLTAREVQIVGSNRDRARISRQMDKLPDKLAFPLSEMMWTSETSGR